MTVRDVERVIANPVRDCEERARIAAVLVALVVDPPLPAADAGAPELQPEPLPPEPPPPPPRAPELEWATLAGATAAWAPGSDGSRTWGAGPQLRGLVGRGAWEVALTAAFTPRRGRDIDRRPEGTGNGYAMSINDSGEVVGLWNGGGHDGYPRWETSFYWDSETPMIGLHHLLDSADPLAAVTYFGSRAVINDAGQIATAGTIDDEWQLVLLTPLDDE